MQCPKANSCNIRGELADCQNNGGTSKSSRRCVRVSPGTTPVRIVREEKQKNNNMATNISRWNNNNNEITHSLLVHVVVLHHTVRRDRQTRREVDDDCLVSHTVVRLANICCGWLSLVLYLNRLSAI